MNKLLQNALGYAKRGWFIFPLQPYGKRPLPGSNGLLDATTDPAQITEWWRRTPNANIGVDCGRSGLVVVDIDTKNGKVGAESLLNVVGDSFDILETVIATTWSGGRHYFYKGDCGSSASQVATDIDIRGAGGYVVLAPSEVREDGKSGRYVWVDIDGERQDIKPFPDIFRPTQRKQLELTEDLTIISGARNQTLTSMAGKMRRSGFSAAEILGALRISNEQRCRPPLPDREILTIAKSVGSYPTTPEPHKIEPKKAMTYEPMSFDQLMERASEDVEWVIENLLRRTGILLLAARPGVGKSDLARNLARAIATGGDYLARRCQKGRVLWVGLEEPLSHLGERIEIMKMHGLDIMYQTEVPVGEQVRWLDGVLESTKPDVVIIDTLGRFFEIKDINHYSEVTAATKALFDLRAKHGTTFVLLHHNNNSDTPLGSTQLVGLADTVQTITKNDDSTRVTKTIKMRSGIEIEPTILTMDQDTGLITIDEPKWRADQRIAEFNILSIINRGGESSKQELVDQCGRRAAVGRSAIDSLLSQGLIASQGTGKKNDPKRYFATSRSTLSGKLSPAGIKPEILRPTPTHTRRAEESEESDPFRKVSDLLSEECPMNSDQSEESDLSDQSEESVLDYVDRMLGAF